jgi:hypothetical protein
MNVYNFDNQTITNLQGRIFEAIYRCETFQDQSSLESALQESITQKDQKNQDAVAAALDQLNYKGLCQVINDNKSDGAAKLIDLGKMKNTLSENQEFNPNVFSSIADTQQYLRKDLEPRDAKKEEFEHSKVEQDKDGTFRVTSNKNGEIINNCYMGQKLFNVAYKGKSGLIDLNKKMVYQPGKVSILGAKIQHHNTTLGFMDNALRAGVPCPTYQGQDYNFSKEGFYTKSKGNVQAYRSSMKFMQARDKMINKLYNDYTQDGSVEEFEKSEKLENGNVQNQGVSSNENPENLINQHAQDNVSLEVSGKAAATNDNSDQAKLTVRATSSDPAVTNELTVSSASSLSNNKESEETQTADSQQSSFINTTNRNLYSEKQWHQINSETYKALVNGTPQLSNKEIKMHTATYIKTLKPEHVISLAKEISKYPQTDKQETVVKRDLSLGVLTENTINIKVRPGLPKHLACIEYALFSKDNAIDRNARAVKENGSYKSKAHASGINKRFQNFFRVRNTSNHNEQMANLVNGVSKQLQKYETPQSSSDRNRANQNPGSNNTQSVTNSSSSSSTSVTDSSQAKTNPTASDATNLLKIFMDNNSTPGKNQATEAKGESTRQANTVKQNKADIGQSLRSGAK